MATPWGGKQERLWRGLWARGLFQPEYAFCLCHLLVAGQCSACPDVLPFPCQGSCGLKSELLGRFAGDAGARVGGFPALRRRMLLQAWVPDICPVKSLS